jgi:hypothetical protein
MPRKSATATAEPTMVNAEALQRRSQELFRQSLDVYRNAVASAGSDGQIPANNLDAICEACRVTGVPVEQFPDDVETFRRHRQLAERSAAMRSEKASREQAVRDATADVERLERELADARNRVRLNGDWFWNQLTSAERETGELENRFPHLFGDAASVTPEIVKRKLTTRAFFVR